MKIIRFSIGSLGHNTAEVSKFEAQVDDLIAQGYRVQQTHVLLAESTISTLVVVLIKHATK